jgi:mRNA interferase HigB
MRVIAKKNAEAYWRAHPETEAALRLWLGVANKASWRSMNDVQARWRKAKALNGERARFEIAGGDYRLVAAFKFGAQIVWIKFIGTHAEYDRIDALTVSQF